jgi:hypothetical protein
MGRKIRAAKASLVAAFLATGGAAATAKAGSSSQADRAGAAAQRSSAGPLAQFDKALEWGSPLVRFLKLDGFPAYLKVDGFAQYYKLLTLDELSAFYYKDQSQVDAVLALYHKGGTASGSLLEGILIGLEQYWKYDDSDTLTSFLKFEDAQAAYLKFEDFFGALERDANGAFSFFVKETGIAGLPAVQLPGEIG